MRNKKKLAKKSLRCNAPTRKPHEKLFADAKMLPVALAVSSICAGGAYAQDADSRRLDEIIVTAQKREENVQDIPITINHVTGQMLRDQAIETLKDVKQLIPGITIRENNDPRNIGLFIRGIGSLQAFIGVEPDAAVIVDGEVLARNSSLFGDVHDIEGVSVLKGPQGTLFGKNTVAGALVVTTRRPSLDENSGNVRLSIAESGEEGLGEYHVSGTYNWVTSDKSAFRLNIFTTENDGWVENVLDGPNGGESDASGARIQFLHKPNDKTTMVFRAEASERNLGPGTRVFLKRDDWTIGTNFGQIPQAVVDGLGLSGEALDNLLITNLHEISQTPTGPENNKTSALNNRDYGFIDSTAASFELNYDFDSGHQLTFTSHYRNSDLETNDSILSTGVDVFPLAFAGPVRSDTFQNELRIASPLGEKIDFVAGAFFLHSKVTREQRALACQDPGLENSVIDANFEVTSCGGEPFGFDEATNTVTGFTGVSDLIFNREFRNNDLVTTNTALFGQLNYHLNNQWTAVLGGRLLYEHQDFSLDVRDDGVPNVDVRPTLIWILDENGQRINFPGVGRFNVPNPLLGSITDNPATDLDARDPSNQFTTASAENRDTAFIYKAALQYSPTDDVMLYTSYSTGYKGVGWFSDSDVRQADLDNNYPIPPEESTNFEVGIRSEWFDGDLRLNLTYFDAEFEHYQERLNNLDFDLFPIVNGGLKNILNDPNASGQPIRKFDIIDAGTLESSGIDAELIWSPAEWLTIGAAWNHVTAEFADTDVLITCGAAQANAGVDVASCTAPINYGEFFDYTFGRFGQFFELDGAQLANAPEDTLTADARVDFPIGNWNTYIRWNYRYQTEEFTNHGGTANNDSGTTVPQFGIHNLFVGTSSQDGKYNFTVYVKNLFDKNYYARKTTFGDGLAERAVGAYPVAVPELIGIAQAYPTYGAVPDGRFFRQRPEHGQVPRDFNRYVGASFEMRF